MKVKRNTLLLLACLVWSVAGFNIFRIGLEAYPIHLTSSFLYRPECIASGGWIIVWM